jgi:hypothetical protein
VQDVYARYEEAAAEADMVDASPEEDKEVIADSDMALDLFQQARKRRQLLAATSASIM